MNQETSKKDFRVVYAGKDSTERRYVFENMFRYRGNRDAVTMFAALNDAGEVIGYIYAHAYESKNLNPPGWFIGRVHVNPDYRRKGVATALFDALYLYAGARKIPYFVAFAQASVQATMFWREKGFCMEKGKKQEDPSRPLEYGNYNHIIHRSIISALENTVVAELPPTYQVVRVDSALRNKVLDAYFPKHSTYFASVREDLFGFAAVNEQGEPVGYILAREEDMGAPLTEVEWIAWHYVEPAFRKQGIGSALLQALRNAATDPSALRKPMQLHPICPNGLPEESAAFYRKRAFHIAFFGTSTTKEGVTLPWPHVGQRLF